MKVGLVSVVKSPFLGEQNKHIQDLLNVLNFSSLELAFITQISSVSLCQPVKLSEIDRLILVADSEDLGNFVQSVNLHKDKIIGVEPSDSGVKYFSEEILPALESQKYNYLYLKTFGLNPQKISEVTEPQKTEGIQILLRPTLLECDIIIKYPYDLNSAVIDNFTSGVKSALKDNIYADRDISLAEAAMELLIKKDKKIAVAESFTGGNISAALVAISGASKTLIEGITAYSNTSKIHRLDVDTLFLEREGAVSQEIVYQMAAGLLSSANADFVIATTGYADPSDEQAGLCYIAIGERRGIHIYKNNFKGTRAEVIQSGVKTALFRLITLLKKS